MDAAAFEQVFLFGPENERMGVSRRHPRITRIEKGSTPSLRFRRLVVGLGGFFISNRNRCGSSTPSVAHYYSAVYGHQRVKLHEYS